MSPMLKRYVAPTTPAELESVSKVLEELATPATVLVHNRLDPKSDSPIDHILFAQDEVYVVDTHKFPKDFSPKAVLRLYRRDFHEQLLRISAVIPDIPVFGILCFVGWPEDQDDFVSTGILVTSPERLASNIELTDWPTTYFQETVNKVLAAFPATPESGE